MPKVADRLLSAFDVSLEEVGLSYATLLRRSGLYLAVWWRP